MADLWGEFDQQQTRPKAAKPQADALWAEFDAPADAYDFAAVERATAATPNLGDLVTDAAPVVAMPQERIDAGFNFLLGDIDPPDYTPSATTKLLTPSAAPLTPGDVQREYTKRRQSGLSRFADTNITTDEMLYRLRSDDAERQPQAPDVERGDVSDFAVRQMMRVPEIGADLIELPHTISDAIYGERGNEGSYSRSLIDDLRRPGQEMDAAGFGLPGTDAADATAALKGLTGFDTGRPVFAEQPSSWQELFTVMKASPWLVTQSGIDMLFAMGAPEAYVAALTNDAANERARNDGRDFASLGDLAIALPGQVAQVGLERFATGRLGAAAPEFTGTGQALSRIGREGAIQIGTENIEELADLASRQAGTERGISGDDVLQTMVGATLAGAPLTGVQAGKESLGALRTPAAPAPEKQAPTATAPTTTPPPVLDTARIAAMLGDLAAEPASSAPVPAAAAPEADTDLAALLANSLPPEQLAAVRIALGDLISPAPSPASPATEPSPAPAAAQSSPKAVPAGNDFKPGAGGYRYRVSRISANGGLMLEKRSEGGSASGFYVGRDGGMIDADTVNFADKSTVERVWKPTDDQAAQASDLLDQMGRLELGTPARKAIQQRLKDLVTGSTSAQPSMPALGDETTGQPVQAPAAQSAPVSVGADLGSRGNPFPQAREGDAPVGSWVRGPEIPGIADTRRQVRDVPLDQIDPTEFDSAGEIAPERRRDAEAYAERLRRGETAPNGRASELPNGKLKLQDGHRRYWAAKATGAKTMRLAVSPISADTDLGDAFIDENGQRVEREGRAPEPAPRRADRDQVLSMRSEIGWSSRGGELVREAADASAMNEDERQGLVAQPKGAVVGRTSWIGQPSPMGGESAFWRDRPSKWTEQQANAAFDAFEAGKPLTKQQQRIINHAQSVADTYAQAEAEQAAELAAYDEVAQQREFAGLREDIGEAMAQADRTQALTYYQLITRAVKAGHSIDALDALPGESSQAYHARLWNLPERTRGPDAAAAGKDQAAGDQGRAGGDVAAAEALGDFALEQQPAATEPASAQEVTALGDFALASPQKSEAVEDDEARRTIAAKQTGLFGASETRRAADEQREAQSRNAPAPSVGGGLFAQRKVDDGPLESVDTPAKPSILESLDDTQELTDADLTEDERAAFARQSGGREAQLRAAIDAALGTVASKVKYLPDYKSLPERLRSGVESRLRQRGGSGQTTALFDPKTGDVYLFTNANPSPERAVFNVAHEIAGHQGLRALLGDSLNKVLDIAAQNPTVAAVAEAIALERGIDASTDAGHYLSIEEALAELAAAVRTGNYDLIADRYGVDVPQGIRASVARAVENFLRRLKSLFDKQGAIFSDEDVRELLEAAWQAAQGEAAVDGDAADSTAPDQTQTAEFRRWFGDSKVVDIDGTPLVVHHGAPDARFMGEDATFKSLSDRYGEGRGVGVFWFASSLDTARTYAKDIRAFDYQNAEPGVVSAYLKIENPLIVDAKGAHWRDAQRRGKTSDVIEEAQAAGHDGVIIKNVVDDYQSMPTDKRKRATNTYVVFDSRQIKSATANRGTFDPDSPSILESVAEPSPANATGRSVIADGRLLSLIDAAKAAGLDLSALKSAHAGNSASAFVQAIDDLLAQMRPKARVTSTKNAITDAEREAAGRHPILRDAVQTNEETIVRAMRELRDDPSAGPEAVQRLAKNGAGGISLADEAILLVHKTELLNQREAAAKKLADPNASEESKEVARQQWTETEAQITVLDQAAVNSGREWGRLGQFRQRMLREDFTLAALERKERARLERPLTPDESVTIAALAARIADLQSQVDMLQSRAGNAESEGAYEALVKQLSRPAKSRPTLESLRKAANDARARLKAAPSVPSRNRQSGAIMSPSLFADYAIIGAYHIANGAAKFADWVGAMRADLGERFDAFKAEHPNIFKAAQRQMDKPIKADATVAEVLEKVDPANLKPKDVRKLIEALVGEGLRGEQAVIKAAAEHLEIAEDEVRALFVQTERREPTLSEAQEELRDLKKLVRLQNEIDRLEAGEPKPPRGAPREDSPAVAERKAELAEVRKRLKPVRDPEGRYQELRGKQIEKRIAELQDRIARGDFATKPRVPRALSEANQRAAFELEKAKQEFLRHQFEDNLRKRTPIGKVFGLVGDTFNLARAMMTSFDLSAILRQGGFITYGHPVRALKSVGPSLKSFASAQAEHTVKTEIEARQNAPLYKRYGLQLTGIGSGPLTQIEEAYASRWLDKFPTWLGGGLVRGSGRAYTAFLNKLRADSFDAMAATLGKRGTLTEVEGKAIANYINVATGRGKVGKNENAAQALNTVFFAPRLVASRFQLLAGQPIYGGTARTRKLIVQEYARFVMGAGVVMALAAFGLAGDDDEPSEMIGLDPRSSDFLKIKVGNTYLDPMAGLAQVSTFLARIATGETVTGGGAVKPLRPEYTLTDLRRALGEDIPDHKLAKDGTLPFGAGSAFDVIARFMRTKLAPIPGAIVNTLAGSNVIGEEVTPLQAAGELVTPMSFQNIGDVMEEQGIPKGTAITLLGLLGMGVQYRGSDEGKQARDALKSVDAAKSDIEDRLATLPPEQWEDALATMKKEYAPLLEGVELDVYERDGKFGNTGDPRMTKDGKPVLSFEGKEGVGSVMGELEGYPGFSARGPYTTEGSRDRIKALDRTLNVLGDADLTRAAAVRLTERLQLQVPAAQDLYGDTSKDNGGEKLDRKTRDALLEQVRFVRDAEEQAAAALVESAKGGKPPAYNAAKEMVQKALQEKYPDRL